MYACLDICVFVSLFFWYFFLFNLFSPLRSEYERQKKLTATKKIQTWTTTATLKPMTWFFPLSLDCKRLCTLAVCMCVLFLHVHLHYFVVVVVGVDFDWFLASMQQQKSTSKIPISLPDIRDNFHSFGIKTKLNQKQTKKISWKFRRCVALRDSQPNVKQRWLATKIICSFCFILFIKQNGRCGTKTNETHRNETKRNQNKTRTKTMKNIQFSFCFTFLRKSL